VDGEKARAEAGDVYTGGITDAIEGPFKGGSGTGAGESRAIGMSRCCGRILRQLRDPERQAGKEDWRWS
jgi:hypothetical protein